MKKIIILLMSLLLVFSAGAFVINSPEERIYYADSVELDIQSEEDLDNLSYFLDSVETLACEYCNEHQATLELEPGNYTLEVISYINEEQEAQSIWFEMGDFELEIIDPEDMEYDYENIEVSVLADIELDMIEMKLDDDDYETACEDCDEFETSVFAEEGEHTLYIRGTKDDLVKRETVDFVVDLGNINLRIVKPVEDVYENDVFFKFLTDIPSNLTYVLDGDYFDGCNDCTRLRFNKELDNGEHSLTVFAYSGEFFEREELDFTVADEPTINLRIITPKAKEYNDEDVFLKFRTDLKSDITYKLDGEEYDACEDCISFTDTVELEDGEYTLRVFAERGNETQRRVVTFTVDTEDADDDEDEDDDSRFAQGYEKLPKMLAAGEIDDEELAEILRNNVLPPGHINRLIKTGLLGEESIEAILETQFNPPGILKKLFGFFGFKMNTYAEQIHDHYNLSEKNQKKLITRDDLPKRYSRVIKNKLESQVEEKLKENKQKSNGSSYSAGVQTKTNYGQSKKYQFTTSNNNQDKVNNGQSKKTQVTSNKGNSNEKVNYGQSKKYGNSGSNPGKGNKK